MYDDNVLGLAPSVSPIAAVGVDSKSDVSQTLEVGVLFDKKLSRQYITGTAKAGETRYDNFKALNFDSRDLAANWNWFLGNRLQGNLGVTYAKGLTPFTDFHQLLKNTRTQKREYFDGAWRFHPSWRARTSLSKSDLEYDLLSQKSADRTEVRSEMGLDYLARSGSSIGLLAAHINGDYPNRLQVGTQALTNSYKQDELKANIDWLVSGKTRLRLLAGQVSRSQADPRIKDFNGFNARLTADWLSTGKLGVTGAVWRETGIVNDLSAIYSVNKGVSLMPRWQISEKVLIEMMLKYERRDFSQSIVSSANFFRAQQDSLRTASLAILYKPLRNTIVQTSIFHSAKSSEFEFGGYRRNGVSISVQQQL